MNSFSIAQLAQFSGIKAHTIRIWEQRYNALQPDRSAGNTRSYSDLQLRRLLNIVSLSDAEYKVSELCMMSDQKLFNMVKKVVVDHVAEPAQYYISQFISAGMRFDDQGFGQVFESAIVRHGMKDTYLRIIHPMLVRLGFMWSTDSIPPAHEHFISQMIRQKLDASIEALPSPATSAASWLLFLPENEFHETGLLFAQYLIKSLGRKSTYMGSNLPFDSLKVAAESVSPINLLLFYVHSNETESARHYLGALSKEVKCSNIFVAGNKYFTDQLGKVKKVRFLNSVDELVKELS
jgi:DNA-binding transcriptional MerR regulator